MNLLKLSTYAKTIIFRSLFIVGLLFSSSVSAEVLQVTPRDGVTIKLLLDVPEAINAKTPVAILFPGGHGRLVLEDDGSFTKLNGNFLVRSRSRFVENGIAIAVLDAPSDHQDKAGLTFDYRSSSEHFEDIGKVIFAVRARFPGQPIWLVGTSRGSTSAANAAANLKTDMPDGLILTSSVGIAFKKGGNVTDFNLDAIRIPTLVVHHLEDGCAATTISGARAIYDALTNAARRDLIEIDGGRTSGDPCKGGSYHGFLGIENDVIDKITAWMKGS